MQVRDENTTPSQFSESVRKVLAAGLSVELSPFSRHDKKDLLKQMYRASETVSQSGTTIN